jgi:DNA-binding HxlR family transcriptional regulator
LIIRELLTGPKRFSDLLAGLPGIATNLLASRLRAMEDNGLIERVSWPPPVASTVYTLTALGRQLEDAVHALVRWGGHFMRARVPRQSFRPHWFGVALQALLKYARVVGKPLLLAIELPEGSVKLGLEDAGVRIVGDDNEVDVRLSGPAELLLGLAAGVLSWEAALNHGLRVVGSESKVASLRAILSQGASRS